MGAIADHHDSDVTAHAADLRDAAINASAAAWRVTGLDACLLIKNGDAYGRPILPEEIACAAADSFGWSQLAAAARRIADAWTQAAEAWQAADAQLQAAKPAAIAELTYLHVATAKPQPLHAELEARRSPPRPEKFRISIGRSSRTMRRETIHLRDAPAD